MFDTAHSSSGYGLHSMRERAELLHGSRGIVSAPGSGTTVIAVLPVSGARDSVLGDAPNSGP